MDKIRENTLLSLQADYISKGDNRTSWDRIRFKLSCPIIISATSKISPLFIVAESWRFERKTFVFILAFFFKKNTLHIRTLRIVYKKRRLLFLFSLAHLR